MMDFWNPVGIDKNQTLHWHIGALRLWIRRTGSELCIYHEETPEETSTLLCAADQPAPEDATWQRWSVGEESSKLQLKPVMPDRPVVVRPENALAFCKNVEEIFYARIPFRVSILTGEETAENLLWEIPTRTLSNTWFGPDTMRGELCYGMQSSARQSLEGVEPVAHRVICPVMLKNTSDGLFDLKRLCIYTQHLNVYCYAGKLWTSRQEITFRGENKRDQLQYNDKWFEEEGDEEAELVSERRTPVETRLFKRSMQSLQALVNAV